jgi:hypothetical protein
VREWRVIKAHRHGVEHARAAPDHQDCSDNRHAASTKAQDHNNEKASASSSANEHHRNEF